MAAPGLPDQFRQLRGYLALATQHETKDPIVTYYTKMYMLQRGMEIDRKSPECRTYLAHLMDQLEQVKAANGDTEAIQTEVVGQAHIENTALTMFGRADSVDRAGQFSKNLVKVFYSCSLFIDVLKNFGELSEDLAKCQKYAKWKAAYINKCFETGQTPIPGPLPEDGEEDNPQPPQAPDAQQPGASLYPDPASSYPSASYPPAAPGSSAQLPVPGVYAPPTTPSGGSSSSCTPAPATPTPSAAAPSNYPTPWQPPANPAAVNLTPAQYQQGMKYCKYAASAMQYQDNATAIDNLTKALKLLTTGQET